MNKIFKIKKGASLEAFHRDAPGTCDCRSRETRSLSPCNLYCFLTPPPLYGPELWGPHWCHRSLDLYPACFLLRWSLIIHTTQRAQHLLCILPFWALPRSPSSWAVSSLFDLLYFIVIDFFFPISPTSQVLSNLTAFCLLFFFLGNVLSVPSSYS